MDPTRPSPTSKADIREYQRLPHPNFIYQTQLQATVNQGSQGTIFFTLGNLGSRINVASLWQTYKLNSLELIAYQPFNFVSNAEFQYETDPFTLNLCPYSRDTLQGSGLLQNIDPQSIPGCQTQCFTQEPKQESHPIIPSSQDLNSQCSNASTQTQCTPWTLSTQPMQVEESSTETETSPSSPLREQTPQDGSASCSPLNTSEPEHQESRCNSLSSSALTSPLRDCDGQPTSSSPQSRVTHWALTLFPTELHVPLPRFLEELRRMNGVTRILVSALDERGNTNPTPHHHVLMSFARNVTRSVFSPLLRRLCWISPVVPRPEKGIHSIQDAVKAYQKYLMAKGKLAHQTGSPLVDTPPRKQTLANEILVKVQCGTRMRELERQHPQMILQIAKLMKHRRPRMNQTKAHYIYGPPGVGKSTTVMRVLRSAANLGVSFYMKMGGLSKFWDGYDNDPICFIDDPDLFNIKQDMAEVVAFKNCISYGPFQVEIKFGSMQFDSKLVIISCNTQPEIFCASAGPTAEAISRRIGKDSVTGRPFHAWSNDRARNKLMTDLCTIISTMFNVNYDALLAGARAIEAENVYVNIHHKPS